MSNWKPYGAQTEALRRAKGRKGFGWFMEQGLGKTSTSYGDFLENVAEGNVDRMLTFCPNSFKGGWREEVEKWGFNVEPIVYEAGNPREYLARFRRGFSKPPNLIINYESARTDDAQQVIRAYIETNRGYAVADESIKLKDPKSAQTQAVLAAGQMFEYTRVLSGKPVTQGPHDLWAQMRFIKQLEGRMFYPFKTAFCKMGGFKMKQVVGAQNEDILAELIEPHVFRATKAEWTDLPSKSYTVREYTMTPAMKSMYRQMHDDFILWLNDEENVSVDAAITKYIKLAQIQCGFIIREDGTIVELVEPSKNPRLAALKEVIGDEIRGKVTIPYSNKYVFSQLSEALSKLGVTYIRGGMSPEEINEQKKLFNTRREYMVMLLQTEAAKYGHTLLGLPEPEYHCSTQVFYQNTYSLDSRSQIEDRSHRYGQLAGTEGFQEMMSYFDLVGTPLDRDAVKALQRKESVFQAIFQHIRNRH